MSNDLSNFEISDDEIIEYKLILIGDSSVGKTCLFKKITSGIFLGRNVSTVVTYCNICILNIFIMFSI